MVVELGLFALVISCLLATAQAFFGLVGAHYGNKRWMAAARPVPRATTAAIILRIASICSGAKARSGSGRGKGQGRPSACTCATPKGSTRKPPLAKGA